jgi:hypothetical protein
MEGHEKESPKSEGNPKTELRKPKWGLVRLAPEAAHRIVRGLNRRCTADGRDPLFDCDEQVMITASRIRASLQRTPFRPLRIFLSDGSRHDVPHLEFAWVFGGRIFIGVAGNNGAGTVKELAILHVTRIEEMPQPRAKK